MSISLDVYVSPYKPIVSQVASRDNTRQATWPASSVSLLTGEREAVVHKRWVLYTFSVAPEAGLLAGRRPAGENETFCYAGGQQGFRGVAAPLTPSGARLQPGFGRPRLVRHRCPALCDWAGSYRMRSHRQIGVIGRPARISRP